MFPKGGTASGMEMMLKSLKAFVPPEIWAMVEKNIIAMVTKVSAIESDLKEIKALLRERDNGTSTDADGPRSLGAIAAGGDSAGEPRGYPVAINGE